MDIVPVRWLCPGCGEPLVKWKDYRHIYQCKVSKHVWEIAPIYNENDLPEKVTD